MPQIHPRDNDFSQRSGHGTTTFDGTVVNAMTSKPVSNARVELRDANGNVVSSAYTDVGGGFNFGTVPQGLYRLVTLLGVSQVDQEVDASAFSTSVSVRMDVNNTPQAGNSGNTVSVAQYKIPEKARNEFQKAQQASAKLKLADARKHVGRALELDPNYADALTLRAILNLSTNIQGAVADLQKAIQSDGNYALAYTVLGSALNMQAKFDQALHTLERGESLAPDSWQTYFEMARSYVGKSDYQSALRAVDRAQSLISGEYPAILLIRAEAHLGLGLYNNAMSELQTYLQKYPSGPNTAVAQKMLQQTRDLMAKK
ncbi:MAG TPA: carboxypeptidase regulatory-like domain-containing protein [Candidatus Angelobacter sp.]|nr:carboxypeptidase regulatory-like domain-containing protein [Candidatus Angelobacter sp.]